MLQRFLRDKRGARAIECGLIAAGLTVAVLMIFGK
jgi:Flp pilus assembly pilin Flp